MKYYYLQILCAGILGGLLASMNYGINTFRFWIISILYAISFIFGRSYEKSKMK